MNLIDDVLIKEEEVVKIEGNDSYTYTKRLILTKAFMDVHTFYIIDRLDSLGNSQYLNAYMSLQNAEEYFNRV